MGLDRAEPGVRTAANPWDEAGIQDHRGWLERSRGERMELRAGKWGDMGGEKLRRH